MAKFTQDQRLAVGTQKRPTQSAQGQSLLDPLNRHRLLPLGRLTPQDSPCLQIDTDQRCVRLVASVETVQVTPPDQRRAPVQTQLVGLGVVLGIDHLPDNLVRVQVLADLQQHRARLITGRDKDPVAANHQRTRRIDTLVLPAPPGELQFQFPRRRIDQHQATRRRTTLATGKHQHTLLAMKRHQPRRCVAGTPLFPRTPHLLARPCVKRRNTRTTDFANIHNQPVANQQRCADGAEESLRHSKVAGEIPLPHQAAAGQVQANQEPLGAVNVDAVAVDDRSRPRPAAVAQPVAVRRGKLVLPELLTRLGIETLDQHLVTHPVRIHKVRMTDRRRCVTVASLQLPHSRWSTLGPTLQQVRLGRDTIPGWTQEPGPGMSRRLLRKRLGCLVSLDPGIRTSRLGTVQLSPLARHRQLDSHDPSQDESQYRSPNSHVHPFLF